MRHACWSAWLVCGSLALGLGGLVGCVGGSKGLSSEDKDRLKPYILESPPPDMGPVKIDVNFENKVHLIGFKTEPDVAKPGTDVKLTYYWRCDDTVEDGWRLFTHIEDDGVPKPNNGIGNLDTVGPIREDKNNRQILGPDRWEKGKYYVDEQTYKVADGVKGATITVYTGIWKNDARLRIITGPTDGDNRAIAGQIKTGVVPTPEQHTSNDPPSLTVNKLAANTVITIDGKSDEKEWGGAASTGPFVDVGTGQPSPTSPVNGSAKLLWDDTNVYVLVEVQSKEFYTGFTDAKSQPNDFTGTGQPKLWTKDTIEMMADPDGDGDNLNYYELQINPQNKVFHSQFDAPQQPSGTNTFGHEDWDPKLKSAVAITKGVDGVASGYVVEAQIPWAAYTKANNKPPKPGDSWRVNFYAMKGNGGVAWSPILGQGNFHKASRFGRVLWAVPGAAADADAGAADVAPRMIMKGGMPHRQLVQVPPQ